MGCAFDMHSTSWTDRSYVITLFVLCWLIPLIVIFVAYIAIIYRVKNTFVMSTNLETSSRRRLLQNDERSKNLHRDSQTARSTLSISQRVSCQTRNE